MNSLTDYDKQQMREAIRVACEHYGYGSSLNNAYALKQALQKKLEDIRHSNYNGIQDGVMLMNVAVSASLIRVAIMWLEGEYKC